MKRKEFQDRTLPIFIDADADGDVFLVVFFSKEEDTVSMYGKADQGDALCALVGICEAHGISPETFADAYADMIADGRLKSLRRDGDEGLDKKIHAQGPRSHRDD